ncbi:MAG: four helix bundle protein [Acidobacteria bacterium]|nr:four helix bundle protein [Acidobacteriota bacterium]
MSYKKSRIYQLGYHLALKVESLCRTFPKHEQFALAQQLRNSSRSVVANYVEGYVRQERFKPDHSRFLIYSQGSCDETKFWLELARDIGFLDLDRDIVSETVSG